MISAASTLMAAGIPRPEISRRGLKRSSIASAAIRKLARRVPAWKIFSHCPFLKLDVHELKMPGPKIGEKDPGIEAYVDGRYFTFTGWHLEGTPLEIEEADVAWIDLVERMTRGAAEKPASDAPSPSKEGFDRALAWQLLGFIRAHDRDAWLRVGMAIHHETGGSPEGFELWCQWSLNAPEKYDQTDQRRVWTGFKDKPRSVGVGTLRKMAVAGGYSTVNEDSSGSLPTRRQRPSR